ncbi:MAG: glycosyltransferase family 39 protein [Deltaproteobacteria bacterium]|nr:glycosyltransferase family 39 protein [Deltaproteobacteria bacterium]
MSRGRWPVAGNPSDGRLAALLFALAWISYAYFFHGGSWGPNAALDMTRAIVEQHRVEIDDYRANTGDWASANGHFYLGKNPGSGLFAVPIYFVIHKLFPNAFDSFAGAQAAAHAMTALSFSLFAALGVALLFHWMRRYAPPAAAFGAAVVYALGSLIFLYGSTANAQVIVASCYATAVFAIERATRLGGKRWWLLAGFAAGYAVLSGTDSDFRGRRLSGVSRRSTGRVAQRSAFRGGRRSGGNRDGGV